MANNNTSGLRVALRVEGEEWVAYIAEVGTMKGALRIASIRMNAITNEGSRLAWIEAISAIGKDFIESITGLQVLGMETSPAAEAERSGRA